MRDQQKATLTEKDFEILETKFATKNEFNELKSDVKDSQTILHEIIFEIKAMREELAAVTYRNRDHFDRIENHEDRITTVEKQLNFE